MKHFKTEICGVGINEQGDFFYPHDKIMYAGVFVLDVDVMYFKKSGNFGRANIYIRPETIILERLTEL